LRHPLPSSFEWSAYYKRVVCASFLAQAEIGQLYLSFLRYKNVFRFNVSVYQFLRMDIIESIGNFVQNCLIRG
jgi:heme oxygenase